VGGDQSRRTRHLHLAGERRLSASVQDQPAAAPLPFDDSRRLTGPNLYFDAPGAVLETQGASARDAAAASAWRARVDAMCRRLGWPTPVVVVRAHASGQSLAFTAPPDQLLAATEVNEWAWCAAVGDDRHHAPGHPLADDDRAFDTLSRFAAGERNPALIALLEAARAHAAPVLFDDEMLSLGLGRHARSWPVQALPAPEAVDWSAFVRIPVAMVTGSNGKTTTVRTLAAILRAHGLRTAHSCTDGLFVGGAAGAAGEALQSLESGDYSGPAGARQLLRRGDVEAAVLETARGGMMRRGLALGRADVAIITNVSPDHFGEYGVHSLDDLADVKFTLSRAVQGGGWLVLNADDPRLRARGAGVDARLAWFSTADFDDIAATLPDGAPLCAPHAGRLRLRDAGGTHDLGEIAAMPLTLGGVARHNVANVAAAAMAAACLSLPAQTIRAALAGFGAHHADNPGRLQRWTFGGLDIFLDYAHNPDGLAGLLDIANARRGDGRLALLLGQAGNRENDQIRALAATAARYAPSLVVVKDIDGYLRGREPGEVARLIRDELLRHGLPESALPVHLREADAARAALAWARPGDVLVLPVHSLGAKAEVAGLLDALQAAGWRAGEPLPAAVPGGAHGDLGQAIRSSAPSGDTASA
jgi:UDP-N-acetylmuramyl tripeptide synthase